MQQAEKYHVDEIYIALPSIDDKEVSEVLNICKETKCKLKKLPGIYQFLNDEITLEKLKDVEVQDLLGRDPIKVNLEEIMGYVQDKVVMVTGGGGSIGSELCRQIAKSHPKQLIIVDIYENNAYDIQLESISSTRWLGSFCRRPSSNCCLLSTSLSHDCPCALVSMRTSVSPT